MPRLLVLGAAGTSVATCCAGAHQRTVGSPVTRKGERLCSFEVTRETDHRVASHGTRAIEVQHEGTPMRRGGTVVVLLVVSAMLFAPALCIPLGIAR